LKNKQWFFLLKGINNLFFDLVVFDDEKGVLVHE